MAHECTCLVLVLICVVTLANAEDPSVTLRQQDAPPPARSVLECVLAADWTCVQTKTVRALRLWLKLGTLVEESQEQGGDREVESKEGDNAGDEHEHHEHENNEENEAGGGGGGASSLLEQLAEAIVEGVSAVFLAESEEDRRAVVLRGARALDLAANQLVKGRKKGGLGGLGGHKDHHGLGELLTTIMMLKSGLMAIGTGFSALVQLKSFSIGLLGLIISVARLFMQIRASKQPPPPTIVKIFQVTEPHELEPYPIPEIAHHHYQQFMPLSANVHPEPHDRVFAAQRPAESAVRPVVARPPAATAMRPAVAAAVITRKRQQPVHITPSHN